MALTALLFIALVAGGSVLCFVRHPVWGLYTYVLVFYMDAPSRWWAESLPDLRWSLLVVAVTVVGTFFFKSREKNKITRQSFFSHAPHTLFVLYVIWMYVQFFWTISPYHTDGVTYFTKYAIVMYLIYLLVDNRERVIGFLIAHVLGCFYLGFLAYTRFVGGRLDGVGGAGIDDSNNLGIYMATAVIAAGGLYLADKGWRKILPVLAMPFLLNTLVQAGSRGAFLALLGGCIAMYLYRPPGTTSKVWAYGVIGVFLFVSLASSSFWYRIASIKDAAQQTEQADTSAVSRIFVAKAQWRMAMDHPFGVGHKGTDAISTRYIDTKYWSATGGRSSHNTLLSALVDQGFLGLFIWCAICWKLFRKCQALSRWAEHKDDIEYGWLVATILGILRVTWVWMRVFMPRFLNRADVFTEIDPA